MVATKPAVELIAVSKRYPNSQYVADATTRMTKLVDALAGNEMSVARYYAKHPEKAHYTMAFVLVSGEEAGLLGSKHFAENPPFDLDKVLFLFNFDMVGTGSDGITMVNAIQFPEAFQLMSDLNASQQYFTQIIKKGESCNSDHCPFYEKGVPAVFIHTNGDENRKYHVTDDKAELLPFTKHQEFFNLMTDFVRELPKVPSFRK